MSKKINVVLSLLFVFLLVAGCSAPKNGTTPTATATATASQEAVATLPPYEQRPQVKVAALKGPTGIGMVKLMKDNEDKVTANKYNFELYSAPTDIVGLITTGQADIAAVPTNLAATLYNKTNGNVQLLALNTLGVLYILEKGDTVQTVADLRGKTIYASGQGSTPEYALRYILAQNGVDPDTDVTIEYKAEHTELATLALSGMADIVLLPEPFVTTVTSKDSNIRVALDLNKAWNEASDNSSIFSMGALIVRKEFAKNNKAVLDEFLKEYKASAEYANAQEDAAAELVEKYGIMASKDLAVKAIPNCNIVYIDGKEMEAKTKTFLELLHGFDPKAVGGTLPDETFYYKK